MEPFMRMPRISKASITVVTLASVLFGGCASNVPALSSHELPMRVEAARTRADHDAIALHYEREATAARATADKHRRLAETYKGHVLDGRGWASMSAHCTAVASSYEKLAAEFDRMAAEHRELGKSVE